MSSFLAACRKDPVRHTPVWLMRQAGRYLPEYRALREKHSMLDLIGTPELAAEVTLQPLRRFALDAAILFSDILPPLRGMGLELDFVPGKGPRIHNPISRTYDIDVLGTPPAAEIMGPSIEAARMVVGELQGGGYGSAATAGAWSGEVLPLIGFAGAPFTLASYAIEGGGSKDYAKTKALMYKEPAAWKRLMTKLVTVQADYLAEQATAGASALMVFDSWCGMAVGPGAYERFVAPYTKSLIGKIAACGVPTILFTSGTAGYLEQVASAGADVIGVEHRIDLKSAWNRIEATGARPAVQGNLDPLALQAPWREMKAHVNAVLEAAAGRPGHIFNLGHGVHRETSPDAVARLIDYVHERTAGDHGPGSNASGGDASGEDMPVGDVSRGVTK